MMVEASHSGLNIDVDSLGSSSIKTDNLLTAPIQVLVFSLSNAVHLILYLPPFSQKRNQSFIIIQDTVCSAAGN